MVSTVEIRKRLEDVFEVRQAIVLADVIATSYNELVKTSDFNELKGIVKEIAWEIKDLTQAQKRTEIKVEELGEAQKRTEIKVEELGEAQKESQKEISRLDKTMQKLAEAQKETQIEIQSLTRGLKETRGEVGGLSRSVSYAFENEAYRMLPKILKETYGIEMKEKFIRTEIAGKEINILGRAKMNGKNVVVIGEAKLRLEDRRKKEDQDVFNELEEKVQAVKKNYKEEPIRVLITHYATKSFMKKAKDKEILVIQSFEW